MVERPTDIPPAHTQTSKDLALLHLYVERFNRRDWDGLRELISADARLQVADRYVGRLADSPYFGTYDTVLPPWRLAVGEVDGEAVVIIQQPDAAAWVQRATARLRISDGRIVDITDYWHCTWMLPAATTLFIDEAP